MRERETARLVAQRLGALFGKRPTPAGLRSHGETDFGFRVGQRRVSVEWKSSSAAHDIDAAIRRFKATEGTSSTEVHVLAVPFMGPLGRKTCGEAGVSWLDLSGNAHITGPNLLIHVDGRPNRFKKLGRPSGAFAPKSSRISRCLLSDVGRSFAHGELAAITGVDPGQTSRVLRWLAEADLVHRAPDGRFRVPNPGLLLDAWGQQYDFLKHRVVRGHLPGHTAPSRTERVSEALSGAGMEHAATGLAAAWLYTHHANYRLSTFYVEGTHAIEHLEKIGFRAEERGANTWIVVPKDEGVLDRSQTREGVLCVSPVQVYLDLAAHPERSTEAAAWLRREVLGWANKGRPT